MILLSGHSLTHARRVPLEALSLSLKERESTATMVPASMDGIGVSSWFLDDTEPGRGIVWRVKSIGEAYATNTPTIQLEHVINTLRDRIMFGEITAATITRNSKATTCTAEQAVRYILSYQADWVLGSFGYSVSNPYKFDGDTLFDALETVTASLSNACWTYDMSAYPFRLNIVNKDSTVGSELRAGRNLKTITKTIDKSSMYTRFYPIGKDDLHISGNYVERNANVYGVIEKVETDASIDSESELRRWANERLDVHAEPNVTIDVEGYELANATGESLDRMVLGRACRVPLPEYGTTIQERIVTLTYQDKVHQPDVFKATLANNREDVTKIIADNMKSGGKGKRTSTKQSKEDHAWFEDTDNHVAMCAIGIIGVDAQGKPNWTRLSRLEVNENGIYGEVKSVQGEVEIAKTRIDMNEEHITLEATRRAEGDAELSGKLTVQADRITAEVSRASTAEGKLSGRLDVTAAAINAEVTRAKGAEGTLSGRITVEAGKITQIVSAVGSDGQVTAASICLAINNGGSTATINADKIYLLGQTIANTITANYISSKIATIPSLTVQAVTGTSASFTNLYGGSISFRTSSGSGYAYTNLKDLFVTSLSISLSNNTYTLTANNANAAAVSSVTFSRATSLSGSWSGNTYTVTASPQGNTISTNTFVSTPTWGTGEDVNKATVSFYYFLGEEKVEILPATIDASSRYTAGESAGKNSGWNSCRAAMEIPTSDIGALVDGGNATATVKKPDADQASTKTDYDLTLNINSSFRPSGSTSDITVAELKYGSNVVARKSIPGLSISDYGIINGSSWTKQTTAIPLGLGGSIDLYGGYTINGTNWTLGDKITVTAPGNPYPTSYTLKCTYATASGGGIYKYTFEYTGTSGQFSAGSNYTFHR